MKADPTRTTGRFERIEKAFEEFRSKVEQCRDATKSDMADIQDAYSRLVRLRERYKHEALGLSAAAKQALSKVFDHNAFIESMGNVRVIGDHVTSRDPLLRHIGGQPNDPARAIVWRCMGSKIWACVQGNAPICGNANQDKTPTQAMREFCASQPNAEGWKVLILCGKFDQFSIYPFFLPNGFGEQPSARHIESLPLRASRNRERRYVISQLFVASASASVLFCFRVPPCPVEVGSFTSMCTRARSSLHSRSMVFALCTSSRKIRLG